MTGKKNLMTLLDTASVQLLEKYFGDQPVLGGNKRVSKGTEQIKAYEAVVKYFGPRTKQEDTDKKDSAFEQLRSDFTGSGRKAARRASTGKANGNGAADAGIAAATPGADDTPGTKDH